MSQNQIYILEIAKRIWNRKKLFLVVSVITFILSCAIILPVPRYYTSSVELAPEITNVEGSGGGLSSIASSLGFNIGNGMTTDAIYPELYPELMESNDFLVNLMSCRVKTQDSSVDTTYYQYLKAHQKNNPWLMPVGVLRKLIKNIVKSNPIPHKTKELDIFNLSETEQAIFGKARGNISCSIDKKTGMIQVSLKDQDPLICATMADSVMAQLQDFIIRYRTSKANNDVIYYKKLTVQAKQAYEQAREQYGTYADANTDVILQSVKSKQEDLENDMQLKYNAYSAILTQLQAAEAKLLERTPAFTVVKSASVPIKPAGPKRMAFVLVMLILSWIVTTVYVCRDLYAGLFSLPQK